MMQVVLIQTKMYVCISDGYDHHTDDHDDDVSDGSDVDDNSYNDYDDYYHDVDDDAVTLKESKRGMRKSIATAKRSCSASSTTTFHRGISLYHLISHCCCLYSFQL